MKSLPTEIPEMMVIEKDRPAPGLSDLGHLLPGYPGAPS